MEGWCSLKKKERKKKEKFIELRREKRERRKERYFKKKLLNDRITTANKFLQRDIFFSNISNP